MPSTSTDPQTTTRRKNPSYFVLVESQGGDRRGCTQGRNGRDLRSDPGEGLETRPARLSTDHGGRVRVRVSQSKLIEGPDQYWSTEIPPSRGQYKDLALVALDLLGIPRPMNRLEATIAMVRLRHAVAESPPWRVPEPW